MAHVLLVDDDLEFVGEQVRQAFASQAHRVTLAATGTSGVEKVREDTPDVVILDLCLPDQSGLEVYEEIRAIDARIPVIVVTAGKQVRIALERSEAGRWVLVVADDGAGLPANIDIERSETLGLQLVRDLTAQLNGAIAIDRARGTSITIAFPAPATVQ